MSIEVKLPTAAAEPQPNPPTPVYISIQEGGRVYIGDDRTTVSEIGDNLRYLIRTRNPEEERIFIRADQTTRYGDFMQVMNALQDNGFYSVALVGEDNAPE